MPALAEVDKCYIDNNRKNILTMAVSSETGDSPHVPIFNWGHPGGVPAHPARSVEAAVVGPG